MGERGDSGETCRAAILYRTNQDIPQTARTLGCRLCSGPGVVIRTRAFRDERLISIGRLDGIQGCIRLLEPFYGL